MVQLLHVDLFPFFLDILNMHSMWLSNLKWSLSCFHIYWWPMKTCPFLTSFHCLNSLRILFCSEDKTLDGSSAPSVALVSSSLVELDESELDIFVIFFFPGLDCTLEPFFGTFTRDGDASLRLMWPCIYGRKVTIRFCELSRSSLKDSGPQGFLTSRSSDPYTLRTPLEQSIMT